ncbi:hypothetical protein HZA57_08530 [Candidatus Poribacteria bacterium]|nr:hypothetical protein [Candidatus Poribacteria bacterium]
MQVLVDAIRKAVAAINAWFERAEREHHEQVMEVLRPPQDSKTADDRLKREISGNILELDDLNSAELGGSRQRANAKNAPQPPRAAVPPPPPTPLRSQFPTAPPTARPGDSGEIPIPNTPRNLAGLRQRRHGEQPSPEAGIVQNQRNDTIYNQRNEVVAQVAERYSKYGSAVASSILSKAFLPNGLELLLSRLGLNSVGQTLKDHDQIVAYIDRNGVEAFCEKAGIRYDPKRMVRKPGDSDSEARMKPPTPQPLRQKSPASASPKLELKKVNIRPVTLEGERDPSGTGHRRRAAGEHFDSDHGTGNGRREAPTPVPVKQPRASEPPPPPKPARTPPSASDFLAHECQTDELFVNELETPHPG